MSKKWQKLGLIYRVTGDRHEKLITHAANPLPVRLKGDVYRVFYNGRDCKNRSSIGAVDINIVTGRIIKDHFEPFFCHGPEGSFYADGVSIGNTYTDNGSTYMLFMGWQNPDNEHWRGDIGRLKVKPDLTLELNETTPLLASDEEDPISLSYPWVMQNSAGNGLEMWYGSTISWREDNGEMLHVIKHASSIDGKQWDKKGVAIPYELGVAQAFSRPTVIRNNDQSLDMWFSYRGGGNTYRIGHAHCNLHSEWSLSLSTPDIDISDDDWDSDMIEYPFVLEHNRKKYMLYNGNSYGKHGFGLAVLEP